MFGSYGGFKGKWYKEPGFLLDKFMAEGKWAGMLQSLRAGIAG